MADRLANDLAQVFEPQARFRDIEGTRPGVNFSRALQRVLAACNVLLVLIGPHWRALWISSLPANCRLQPTLGQPTGRGCVWGRTVPSRRSCSADRHHCTPAAACH